MDNVESEGAEGQARLIVEITELVGGRSSLHCGISRERNNGLEVLLTDRGPT